MILPSTPLEFLALGLDQASTPLLLITADGVVCHVNPAGHDMLRRSPILSLRNGKLHTRRRDEARMLFESIEHAGDTRAKKTSAAPLTVTFRDREGCVVTSVSMQRIANEMLVGVIILRIADLISRPTSDPAWIVRVFGLTPAEARVANGLLSGLTLAAIGAREGSAIETIRRHVKRGMAKVSAHSQAQFVGVLASAHGALVVPGTENESFLPT